MLNDNQHVQLVTNHAVDTVCQAFGQHPRFTDSPIADFGNYLSLRIDQSGMVNIAPSQRQRSAARVRANHELLVRFFTQSDTRNHHVD